MKVNSTKKERLFWNQYAMQGRGGMPQQGAGDQLASRIVENSMQKQATDDSGLVLPGNESTGDSSGESKLWLPGT